MATFTFGFTRVSWVNVLHLLDLFLLILPHLTFFSRWRLRLKLHEKNVMLTAFCLLMTPKNDLRHRRVIHIPFVETRLQTQPDWLSKFSVLLIPVFKALKQSKVYILAMNRRKGWLYKHEKELSGEMFIYSFSVHLRAIVLRPSSRPEDKLSSRSLLLCHHSWPSLNHCHNKIKLHCLSRSHLPLAIFCF